MQILQCAVSNSVSHFIVILIHANCFHLCAHAFDEHGSDGFTGVWQLVVPLDGTCASPLPARLSIENAAGATNASRVKSPLWHMKSWLGTPRVTRKIRMKRVKNNVLSRFGRFRRDCERDFSSAGYVIQERMSQLKPSTVDDVLFLHSNLKHQAEHNIV